MENEQDSTGRSRGLNQLHLVPEEWQSATSVIEPLLERVDQELGAPQILVVTGDSEAAAGVAARLAPLARARDLGTLAATSAARARRVLRSATSPHVIIAAPEVAVALLESASLKLGEIRVVVLAWIDALDATATRALESLMAELPKDAARVVLADAATPAVEQLVERYARRARRVAPAAAETVSPVSLSYVVVNEAAREATLRRVLDALDPESALIAVRDAGLRASVNSLLRSLGYASGASIGTGDAPDDAAQVVVLFDLPANESDLRRFAGDRPASRVVALVTPRQVVTLSRLAGGGIAPLVLPEPAARARAREESLRDELRAVMQSGALSRELLAIEPLLAERDGAEVAAAALRLLQTERAKPAPATMPERVAFTRLYVNVGAMDGIRAADLVGAILGETGISKADLGKVDVRDRHSTVEVAPGQSNAVVSKLTGISLGGRRVVARVDEGPERQAGARPRRNHLRAGPRGGKGGMRDR
ncbi:MAG TPA: DbpA RNA binding domain-containing protein [Gemmatimonadaceae bacterium]|nr:DbpA RNA binding domain-containing protein [Gemmatimonadaceae bacterium]